MRNLNSRCFRFCFCFCFRCPLSSIFIRFVLVEMHRRWQRNLFSLTLMQIRWSHSLTLSHTCASFLSPFILFSLWSSTALYISFLLSLILSLSHLLSISPSLSLSPSLNLTFSSSNSLSSIVSFSLVFSHNHFSLFAPAYPFRNLSFHLSFSMSLSLFVSLSVFLSPLGLSHSNSLSLYLLSRSLNIQKQLLSRFPQLNIRFAHFQRPSLVPGLGDSKPRPFSDPCCPYFSQDYFHWFEIKCLRSYSFIYFMYRSKALTNPGPVSQTAFFQAQTLARLRKFWAHILQNHQIVVWGL